MTALGAGGKRLRKGAHDHKEGLAAIEHHLAGRAHERALPHVA